ncbi:hypothetical protein ASG24_13385 [Methylophilus sp. Leaf414]|nr:hypothetical protein ASG24_13385 [Methylophilus sp. Leaf414]KQT42498.1 hypothetical protein ASG34_07070 [Methylophilus sp. Leaf416]KQT56681.1 hypothetical protein ASG44_07045 [Methylophilus sp. Leaf459]
MSTFVRNFTIVLTALSMSAGIFAESLLSFLKVEISSVAELRWTLIIGMPILLFVLFIWLNQQHANTVLTKTLQSFSLLAIFLAPYLWVLNHAQ